jgi:polysaccharide pyruvyl transferase WcaK-like protein
LGTRLHSCILAACAKTPVVAIRYQGFKTEGIMAELGLESQLFDISEIDINGIENAICKSYETREAMSKQIERNVAKFRASLMLLLDRVLP